MNKNTLVLLSMLIVTIPGIGIDLYTPSMPAIAVYYHALESIVTLTIGCYMLGYALGQLLFGTASDSFGRKKSLLFGMALFSLASFAAAHAPNIEYLILMRTLQGIGAASASVLSKAILVDQLEGKALQKAMAYVAFSWGLGPILGPFIGGYLQFYFNWHANFYFYTSYSLLLLGITAIFLKESLVTPKNFNASTVLQHYQNILTHSVFIAGAMCVGLLFSTIVIFNIFAPFLIQTILHHNAAYYGQFAFMIGAAYLLGVILNRLLLNYFKDTSIMFITIIFMVVISFIMLISSYTLPLSTGLIITPICFLMISVGIAAPSALAKTLSLFPDKAGSAGALMGTLVSLIIAIFSLAVSFLHAQSLEVPAYLYFTTALSLLGLIYIMLQTGRTQTNEKQINSIS